MSYYSHNDSQRMSAIEKLALSFIGIVLIGTYALMILWVFAEGSATEQAPIMIQGRPQ